MDDFNPNDFADLSQLLGDVPAETPESGAAPTETPVAAPESNSEPVAVATPNSQASVWLASRLEDIERRLAAIEAMARRNGWSL